MASSFGGRYILLARRAHRAWVVIIVGTLTTARGVPGIFVAASTCRCSSIESSARWNNSGTFMFSRTNLSSGLFFLALCTEAAAQPQDILRNHRGFALRLLGRDTAEPVLVCDLLGSW